MWDIDSDSPIAEDFTAFDLGKCTGGRESLDCAGVQKFKGYKEYVANENSKVTIDSLHIEWPTQIIKD